MLLSTQTADMCRPTRSVEHGPRVIQQFTALFFVSRDGDVWRIYDSESLNGWGRRMPSTSISSATRVFVGIGRTTAPRLYRFGPDDARDVIPEVLQQQFERSAVTTTGIAV
jgi:hypothetical protein